MIEALKPAPTEVETAFRESVDLMNSYLKRSARARSYNKRANGRMEAAFAAIPVITSPEYQKRGLDGVLTISPRNLDFTKIAGALRTAAFLLDAGAYVKGVPLPRMNRKGR